MTDVGNGSRQRLNRTVGRVGGRVKPRGLDVDNPPEAVDGAVDQANMMQRENNGGAPHEEEPLRMIADRTEWRANGVSNTRSMHEDESQCGGCQQ